MLTDLPAVGSQVRVRMITGPAHENRALRARVGTTGVVLTSHYGTGHPVQLRFEDGYRAVFKLAELDENNPT